MLNAKSVSTNLFFGFTADNTSGIHNSDSNEFTINTSDLVRTKINDSMTILEQTKPTTPSAGYQKIYMGLSKKLQRIDSKGNTYNFQGEAIADIPKLDFSNFSSPALKSYIMNRLLSVNNRYILIREKNRF